MRPSGTWTVHDGRPRKVSGRVDGDTVRLFDEEDLLRVVDEVPVTEVGAIEKVVTHARWRGGEVVLGGGPVAETVGFYTNDRDLAAREGLRGDQHSGWSGSAPVGELADVEERVTVLRDPEAER